MSTSIEPVPGAAKYVATYYNAVVMIEADGTKSDIQQCKSSAAAYAAADRWQRKENAAVTREAKRLAKARTRRSSELCGND